MDDVHQAMQDETGKPAENFVQNWLLEADSKFPESLTRQAVSGATELDQLNEAALIKQLRALARTSQKENVS